MLRACVNGLITETVKGSANNACNAPLNLVTSACLKQRFVGKCFTDTCLLVLCEGNEHAIPPLFEVRVSVCNLPVPPCNYETY